MRLLYFHSWKSWLTKSFRLFQVRTTKKVSLSAESIGTTQIILNSGIGNSTYLSSIEIPAFVDLPSVGQNL